MALTNQHANLEPSSIASSITDPIMAAAEEGMTNMKLQPKIRTDASSSSLIKRNGGGFLKNAYPTKGQVQMEDQDEYSVGLYLDDEEGNTTGKRSSAPPVCAPCVMADESASSAYSDTESDLGGSSGRHNKTSPKTSPKNQRRRKRRMRISRSFTSFASLAKASSGSTQEAMAMASTALPTNNPNVKSVLRKASSYGCLLPCCQVIPINTRSKAWKQLPVPRHVPDFDYLVHQDLLEQQHSKNAAAAPKPAFSSLFANSTVVTMSPQLSLAKHLKRVSFSDVNIREHAVTVGDNPSCHLGAPLSLDWSYNQHSAMTVDFYEYSRTHRSGRQRRSYKDLRMPMVQRHELLLQFDISEEELHRANQEREKAQRQREKTRDMSLFVPTRMEVLVESAIRKVKRSVSWV